ncbi:MAG: enoyl-CoA hydratase/isomerase family protein [Pseudomonadales bacterium]|nr:enoyl-CoA hydratase/isomerase family protein [Pseudomonadales bacterium]
MNTYTAEMGQAWSEAYQRCDDDDDIRVVVVTGNGRAFCAGADMSQGGATFDTQQDMDFSTNPIKPAYQINKPVIAAMNGHAIGIGFSLGLQCDFRIVADEAKYGLLQVRRGVLSDACSHWLLPRLIGLEKAMQVILLGETMSGTTVVEKGLALKSVPADQVFPEAMKMAETMAKNSAPLITAMAKRLLWQSFDMSIDEMEAKETRWLHHSMGKPDAVEGGMAFFEKREPKWRGSVNAGFPKEE